MTNAHTRKLAIATFNNKRATTPVQQQQSPWPKVVEMHRTHDRRPNKDGRMIGGYSLDGTRADANVLFRSIIQLDVDTDGEKDEAGRIVKVSRRR
jgi:hypothetical protein